MPDLPALVEELAHHEPSMDHAAMRRVREAIVAEYPGTPEAAEARYKVGLDALFRERDIAGACGHLEEAAKSGHPYWGAAARTSLGLCYYHQKRLQKALFELRKVASVKEPGANSVVAAMWMERLLLQDGQAAEAQKARAQRIEQLRTLLAPATHPPLELAERGAYLYQLGCALIDHGEKLEGRRVLEEARALGPQVLGPDVARGVAEALKA